MTDLSALANKAGHFTIVALDHRDALTAEFEALTDQADGGGAKLLIDFKQQMLETLNDVDERPSAVMLEPEFSLPALRASVPPGVGVTCALEAQGYFSDPKAGNQLMPGWTPARALEVGADAAKLLVLYRHDQGSFTEAQERLVAGVIADAEAAGVPILIEPVPVDVVDADDRRTVILAAAERLHRLGPMLLKLPFPGSGSCQALTEACGDRPWALLSWGVPFSEFSDQLTEACASGCSGFTVGRALWREAVDPAARTEFLADVFPERLAQLMAIANTGRPWLRSSDQDSTSARSVLDE